MNKSGMTAKRSLPAGWDSHVFLNSTNHKRLTEAHMLALDSSIGGDIIAINVKGDTAVMVLKPGVWERIDSVARLVNHPLPKK